MHWGLLPVLFIAAVLLAMTLRVASAAHGGAPGAVQGFRSTRQSEDLQTGRTDAPIQPSKGIRNEWQGT